MSLFALLNAGEQVRQGTVLNDLLPNKSITLSKLVEGDELIKRDGSITFTGDVNMGSKQIKSLSAGVANGDAVNVGQLFAVVQGFKTKDACRVANTENFEAVYNGTSKTLTASANGAARFDNVNLSLNDRILLWKQTDKAQNGIYFVSDVGSAVTPCILTRDVDADTSAKVKAGMYCWVTEGSLHGDKGFYLITDDPIVLDTTALDFTIFSSAGQVLDGEGLVKVGNTINIGSVTNGCITINPDSIEVKVDAVNACIEKTATGLKFKNVSNGKILIGNADGIPMEQTVSGDVVITPEGATSITTGAVVTAKILNRNVTLPKLAAMDETNIIVGQGASADVASVAMSGDITMSAAGVTAIGSKKVVNGMIGDNAVTNDKVMDATLTNEKLVANTVALNKMARQNEATLIIGQGATTDSIAVAVTNDLNISKAGVATVQVQAFVNNHMVYGANPTESDLTGLTEVTLPSTAVANSVRVYLNQGRIAKTDFVHTPATNKVSFPSYVLKGTDYLEFDYAIQSA